MSAAGRSGGELGQGDLAAELLELSDQVVLAAVRSGSSGEVVTAEVLVVGVVGEEVPADDEDGVADGDGRLFLPMRRASGQNWADRQVSRVPPTTRIG